MTDLLPIETINAVEIFDGKEDTALRALLDRVRAEVTGEVFDVSTAAGRKLCAAVAYKVARSKTAIDEAGKALVADWKEKCKVIDSRRKLARDELDALKD